MRMMRLGLVGALALFAAPAYAQYPTDTVTVVVPASAGGSNDSVGRYVAEALAKTWSVPVIVENRPGAGSSVGIVHVAKSPPDGKTLLVVSTALTTNAVLEDNKSYDPVADLEPIAIVASSQFGLVAGPKSGAGTIAELQALDRELFYGAAGVGSSVHFGTELVNSILGIKAKPVFYKGGTEAMVDLIGGRLDIYMGTLPQLAGNIKAGQVKALAVTGPERDPGLPDIPTLTEAGFSNAVVEVWWGVFAPKGTDPAILDKVTADVNAALATDDAREFFAKLGARPIVEPADYLRQVVSSELEKWRKVKEDVGIKKE